MNFTDAMQVLAPEHLGRASRVRRHCWPPGVTLWRHRVMERSTNRHRMALEVDGSTLDIDYIPSADDILAVDWREA